MTSEAENNLILGVAEGLERNPTAAVNPYLATVGNGREALACAVHIAPFKLLLTRANREPIAALAADAFAAVPDVPGITGRIDPPAIRCRVERAQRRPGASSACGCASTKRARSSIPAQGARRHVPAATSDDIALLTEWTEVFVADARIPENVDSARDRGRRRQARAAVRLGRWRAEIDGGMDGEDAERRPHQFRLHAARAAWERLRHSLRQRAHAAAAGAGQRVLLALHRSLERGIAKHLQADRILACFGRGGVLLDRVGRKKKETTRDRSKVILVPAQSSSAKPPVCGAS